MGKSAEAAGVLAEAFFRSAPTGKKKRVTEGDWAKALTKFHREAGEIRRRYDLGFLARAMAAYYFQRRLMAAGFAPEVVRKVVFSLVLSSFSNQG